MSQDLLETLGYSKGQGLEQNPWRDEPIQHDRKEYFEGDSNDFGEFQAPEEQSTPGTLTTDSVQLSNDNSAQTLDEAHLDTTHSVKALTSNHLDSDWGDFVEQSEEPQPKLHETEAVHSPADQVKGAMTRSDFSTDTKAATLQVEAGSSPIGLNLRKPNTHVATTSSEQKPPPSNVPPPSILLTLTATLFQSLPIEIKDLVASMKSLESNLYSFDEPEFARITLRMSFLRTGARIIAGRKLRWRRDTRLAQSMKMGQAQAGKIGGMKLAGVDRMESRREDQQAAEAVRIWQQEVGSLRTAIGVLKSHLTALQLAGSRTPEIKENMPIRTGKASDNARTAPKCCFLCGLKREERLDKVDVDVFDNFGEWWTDHWGHTDCKVFWLEHEGLDQRATPTSPPLLVLGAARMGLAYNVYLNADKIFGCKNCKTHLASHDAIISRNFRGQHGKAYLFNAVVNIVQAEAVERNMTTGRHVVRDISCRQCKETVGWKYDKAYEASEKYKEGKYILEAELLCTVY
ncbi:MAG: hypothetical protein Q9191_002319 [Dirinaria sp. TL-2023a]